MPALAYTAQDQPLLLFGHVVNLGLDGNLGHVGYLGHVRYALAVNILGSPLNNVYPQIRR